MRYLPESNRVAITADELVALSIAHLQIGTSFGDEDLFGKRSEDAIEIAITAEADHLRYAVCCYAHEVTDEGITLRYTLPRGMASPTKDIEKRARGEAFAAAYAHAPHSVVARAVLSARLNLLGKRI